MTWITSRTHQQTPTHAQRNEKCMVKCNLCVKHYWSHHPLLCRWNTWAKCRIRNAFWKEKQSVCGCIVLYHFIQCRSSYLTTFHAMNSESQEQGVHVYTHAENILTCDNWCAHSYYRYTFEWIFNFAICIIYFHALPQNENGATANRGRCFNLAFGSFWSAGWLVG